MGVSSEEACNVFVLSAYARWCTFSPYVCLALHMLCIELEALCCWASGLVVSPHYFLYFLLFIIALLWSQAVLPLFIIFYLLLYICPCRGCVEFYCPGHVLLLVLLFYYFYYY